ncbi:hypothetical protein HZ326_30707 [Fusarium oxysporum f. sp. albedinis]|nr:hypothetical protein HZ326_30707 [Fusarium oxysporum f. sp. albedinis]
MTIFGGAIPPSPRMHSRVDPSAYTTPRSEIPEPRQYYPQENDFSDTMINCRCQSTAGISGSSVSTRHFRANPQTCPVCSCVGFSQRFSGPINPAAGRNHETLGSFIEALRRQNGELSPDFLEFHQTVYDQAFWISFNSRCHCARRPEVNEPEHTHSLQESVQYLQGSLPPLSTVFGEAGSYDPSSFLRQWKDFLASKPSQPLSFHKSQMHLLPPDEPELLLSRQWDIDSIWFGATGLQAISVSINQVNQNLAPLLGLVD